MLNSNVVCSSSCRQQVASALARSEGSLHEDMLHRQEFYIFLAVVEVVAASSLSKPDQGCFEQDQGESNSGSKKEYGFAEAFGSPQVGYTINFYFDNIGIFILQVPSSGLGVARTVMKIDIWGGGVLEGAEGVHEGGGLEHVGADHRLVVIHM